MTTEPIPHDPSIPARTGRFVAWLIRWRNVLLIAGIVVTALAWYPAHHLQFDRSVELMFAHDDPLIAPYRKLKRTFGGHEVALAAYRDDSLLTAAGFDRLEKLTGALEKVPGVASVFSLSRSKFGKGIINPFVPTNIRDAFFNLCEGYVVSEDRRTAAVVCVLKPANQSDIPRGETVDRLRAALAEYAPEGVLTGEPVMMVDGFRFLERDGQRLGVIATTLLIVVIVFSFRSIRWVVAPMVVVAATLWVTEGLLVVCGYRLSMVSSSLWAIVAVIGIATTIHLVVRYRQEREEGRPRENALWMASTMLAAPIFWACATDAVGFASLMVSKVGPIRDFGLMMALASLVTLVAIGVFVPAIALFGRGDGAPRRAWGEGGMEHALAWMVWWIEHRTWLLLGIMLALTAPPILGLVNLQIETDFTKNFRRGSTIVKAYEFVESNLGGAGVWDIIVPVSTEGDTDVVARVRRLEERLRSEVVIEDEDEKSTRRGLTKVISVVDVIDAVPGASAVRIGNLGATLRPLKSVLPIVRLLHGYDPKDNDREYLRIMLRSHERQSARQKESLIRQVNDIARQEFPEAEVTGFFVLLTWLIDSILRDQWLAFIVATVGIFLMMVCAQRSAKLALIALVPNALPILMVTGMLGWLGLKMNMGAAMIASVSMGLAIDSSVHYLIAYRRQRAAGQTMHEAMSAVHQSVGRAMIFSTLALVAGFSALAMSEFVPTVYFGVLVSLTMLGGLLGNLVLLPLMIKVATSD